MAKFARAAHYCRDAVHGPTVNPVGLTPEPRQQPDEDAPDDIPAAFRTAFE